MYRWLETGKEILEQLSQFIYPPFCLHCEVPLDNNTRVLCSHCFSLLEVVDAEGRCLYCFAQDIGCERKVCFNCMKSPPPWNRGASAVDYEGPAVSLIKAMKYGNQSYLAKGAAALMAAQFSQLNWPFPDLIVPVPIPFVRWIQRGYNQSFYLAKHLGQMINSPVCNALKRRSGDYSQAALSSSQRRELTIDSFVCIKKSELEDKTILLVDDVMTTGTTLKCCAQVLLEGFPKSIYILTVCRTMQ